jgi:hypothetical protein
MKLLTRYRKLNLWNRLSVWGTIASVAGLVVAVGTMVWSNGGPKMLSVEPMPPMSTATLDTTPIRESSARELLRYLEELPPLQRNVVESSSYLGRRVNWRGRLQDIVPIGGGLQASLSEEDGGSPWTIVRFNEVWRQQLADLRKGDTITISGVITGIGTVVIVDGSNLSVQRTL